MSTIIDLTQFNDKEYVYIRVDELDNTPRIFRKKTIQNIQKISICDNRTCSCTDDKEPLYSCTGCFFNKYCCKECQNEDWSFHKDLCNMTCAGCKKINKDLKFYKEVNYKNKSYFVKFCNINCEKLFKF